MHFLSGRLLPVSGPLLPADISKNRLNTHSPKTPEVLFALHDIVRVKGDTFPGMVSLSDHRPVPVVPLATNHPGKQVVIPLSGLFSGHEGPSGWTLFHGNAPGGIPSGFTCADGALSETKGNLKFQAIIQKRATVLLVKKQEMGE
jgi:hypothetical protein